MRRPGYYAALAALALLLLLIPASAAGQNGGLTYANATYTAPPSCESLLVPQLNASQDVRVCAIVRRPEGGGGLHVLTLFTADGTLLDYDLQARDGYADCFGGDVWASGFSRTIKVYMNCKPDSGNGNDRAFFPVDTGIPAYPAGSTLGVQAP